VKYDKYTIEALPSFSEFEFYSEGPKGRVGKRVVFGSHRANVEIYNLAFGDVDESGDLNDSVVTNNGDSQKVLATVALIVVMFSEVYPDYPVLAIGSTPARTRLYQMGIANNLCEIEEVFEVFGFTNEQWEPFKKGVRYEAFLVKRK